MYCLWVGFLFDIFFVDWCDGIVSFVVGCCRELMLFWMFSSIVIEVLWLIGDFIIFRFRWDVFWLFILFINVLLDGVGELVCEWFWVELVFDLVLGIMWLMILVIRFLRWVRCWVRWWLGSCGGWVLMNFWFW